MRQKCGGKLTQLHVCPLTGDDLVAGRIWSRMIDDVAGRKCISRRNSMKSK